MKLQFFRSAVLLLGVVVLFSFQLSAGNYSCLQGGPSGPPVFHEGERINDAVVRLLESPEFRDQAWAAYFIGAHQLSQFTPDLQELLLPLAGVDTWQASYLRLAVFDALIQVRAKVPSTDLMSFADSYPDEVILLLANAPAENREPLLYLFGHLQPGTQWVAVGNLLAAARAPGFAALLLSDLPITAMVVVSDQGTVGVGGGVGGGGVADGFHHVPVGYPPIGRYRLTTVPSPGVMLLAAGRTPVYYERIVVPGNCQGPFSRSFPILDENRMRSEFLAALSGKTVQELGFTANPSFRVVWRDSGEYTVELARILQQISVSFNQLVEQLVEAGLLTTSEAGLLKPKISLRIRDERTDKTVPLPSAK